MRVGTRASTLALAQARQVAERLQAAGATVEVVPMRTEGDRRAEARLAAVGGKRVATGKDFDESTGRLKADADVLLLDEQAAWELQARLRGTEWQVSRLETRQQVRRPYPPFTTSTLQQEANRKLGMSARETMQVAQRLYEDGLITYMRTDSVTLSQEAIRAARGAVGLRPGYAMVDTCAAEFAAETPYFYSTYAAAGSPPEAPPRRS